MSKPLEPRPPVKPPTHPPVKPDKDKPHSSFNDPYAPATPYPPVYHGSPIAPTSELAVISFVTGILSLAFGFCCGCFSLPLSVTAITCGVIGMRQTRYQERAGYGLAVAGIVCATIGFLLSVGLIVWSQFLGR